MIVLQIILTTAVLLSPLGAGFIFLKKEDITYRSLGMAYIYGQFLFWGLFQFLAVPMIRLKCSFNLLFYVFAVLAFMFTLCGVIRARKRVWNLKMTLPKSSAVWILLIFAVGSIGLQLYKYIFGMHIDQDDARFLGEANDALFHNSMLLYSPTSGRYFGYFVGDMVRDSVSPWSIWLAVLAKATMLHPAIIAHTVYAPVLLFLSYLVYGCIGGKLFKGVNEKIIFLLGVSLVHLYFAGPATVEGAPPVHTLTRIWQGKSVVNAVSVPAMLLQFLIIQEDNRPMNWLILCLMCFGTCMMSGMGMIIAIAFIAVYGLYVICCKKFRSILWWILSILPALIYEYIYLTVK